MKILSIFIAVLILVSGFDLCGDIGMPDGRVKTEISKENGKKQDNEAGCSPYCHCVRCSFSLLPDVSGRLGLYSLPKFKFFIYSNSTPAGIGSAVWQPPKAA